MGRRWRQGEQGGRGRRQLGRKEGRRQRRRCRREGRDRREAQVERVAQGSQPCKNSSTHRPIRQLYRRWLVVCPRRASAAAFSVSSDLVYFTRRRVRGLAPLLDYPCVVGCDDRDAGTRVAARFSRYRQWLKGIVGRVALTVPPRVRGHRPSSRLCQTSAPRASRTGL